VPGRRPLGAPVEAEDLVVDFARGTGPSFGGTYPRLGGNWILISI